MTPTHRVAFVTGAASGIGRGIAERLAGDGMAVALVDIDAGVHDVAGRIRDRGLTAVGVVADVASPVSAEAAVEAVERDLGPIWLLVNCAGVYATASVVETTEAAWDRVMDVDAKGVFVCSQAAARRMLGRRAGRIVTLSSIAGSIVRPNQAAYCAAKAAANHFTRCLAVELAPHGITANAIAPGMTRTDMLADVIGTGRDLESFAALIPAGRLAEPSDHAGLVTWLASEDAAHVTGQVISVDGGQSLFQPFTAPGRVPGPGTQEVQPDAT